MTKSMSFTIFLVFFMLIGMKLGMAKTCVKPHNNPLCEFHECNHLCVREHGSSGAGICLNNFICVCYFDCPGKNMDMNPTHVSPTFKNQ
ncbi:hypothetical protein HanXRQr2_Chr14g0620601 [Helianthus annuus]|uniref:Putative low-molecular-weight cysteine-rich 54 n=1 Tax=Helianthus annuus TaxID=4232 RepID=A0A251SD44_HELAN|nr:hypothetical protein HanXRQr2_Chr14g0620601 [Helianthus annuus]KAJ0838492.1 hypothetical protein HanPSC8_Chr14g0595441 [Helianthus annuus]